MQTDQHAAKFGPLHPQHEALGAKFGDFGGWQMPLEYVGGGVLAEHAAVRERVGLFDVSHMGTFEINGAGAKAAANEVFANDLNRIGNGTAQYSLLCSSNGGVVDDLLVYVRADDRLLVVPNASNTQMVIGTAQSILAPSGVVVEDLSPQRGILAIQGPRSAEVLNALGLTSDLDYMTFADVDTDAGALVVARSGYTGEHGYELIVEVDHVATWWDRALAACRQFDGLPCGLGARDTLRTEMAYPLHGHELGREISPVEAGLSWAVGWDKPQFAGKSQLVAAREQGPQRRLRALLCVQRAVPRADMAVLTNDPHSSVALGIVTSGTFSPTLKAGIALALLDPEVKIGDEVSLDVRGRRITAAVVKPPFVDADPKR